MVNTRRKESGAAASEGAPRYHTRRINERNADLNSSSGSQTGTDSDSQEEEEEGEETQNSWTSVNKRNKRRKESLSTRTPHLLKKRSNEQRRFVCEEKRSLRVYSSRKMRDDLDMYNGNDSEEEIYTRGHRTRTLRHAKRSERRSALSLRPIRMKSYVDMDSPNAYNSDDSEKMGVRRSTRNRNMSWLADNQMHKVGYPREYSDEEEEDSRDAHPQTRRTSHEETRRLGNRREIKKNPKYGMFEYETEHTSRRKTRSEDVEHPKRSLRNTESNDKENKDGELNFSRSRRQKEGKENVPEEQQFEEEPKTRATRRTTPETAKEEEQNAEKDAPDDKDEDKEKKPQEEQNGQDKEKDEQESSESEEMPRLRQRPPPRNKRRRRKSSSSSGDVQMGKGYSLRNRAPKVQVQNHSTFHSHRSRFTRSNRRRKDSSNSNSSSDSDDRLRKNKYNKNQGSKNDQMMKSGAGGNMPMPIGPEKIDSKVRFTSVGGLDGHIQSLREMILFPMLYPEVFKKFNVQPPRGVLFYGPPGTGKTLMARALANECSQGQKKVSFFMRKGADLLSKWIGESERQLRVLFEQAQEMKPSIIFFDEMDGLAPVRSSRNDQIHASIVSTLLALMDGLDSRGEVIVIGATNRIDAIDPALRRPGRFDRELFFPLPGRTEREEILKVHVSQWANKPNEQLMSYLAESAIGYCGSDLRALCSEAVIQSFRRVYPQVYNSDYRLLIDPDMVKVDKLDFLRAKSQLVPAAHRVGNCLGRKLLPVLAPVLSKPFKDIMQVLEKTFPHGINPQLAKVKLAAGFRPAQLLLVGNGAEHGQTTHLAPALLFAMEHIHSHILDLTTLHRESARSAEEACIQVFQEVKRNVPSILYIPSIDNWWTLVSDALRAIFVAQLKQLDPNSPILLLATADVEYKELPAQVRNLFSSYRNEVFRLQPPNAEARKEFFKPLIIDASLRPPRPPRLRPRTPPPLPRAPTPPPTPMSEESAKKLFEQEERTLRELRIFLRDMCKKLANNKMFFMFTKPVDIEEVPDYTSIIKQPMDLETMMTKVDFHRYECAKDFLEDIELIVRNALEYNPARTSADKQIRHRACSLRDYAFTIVKKEMDSDFEEKCQEIAKKRKERKASVTQYLPAYIQTPSNEVLDVQVDGDSNDSKPVAGVETNLRQTSPIRKRKLSNWQRGMPNRKKRRKTGQNVEEQDEKGSTDESKENSPEALSPQGNKNSASSTTVDDKKNVDDSTQPLSVNCDLPPPTLTNAKLDVGSPLQSPSTRPNFCDLMSPSELLEDPLEIDDIDQALNEIVVDDPVEKLQIKGIRDELEKVLNFAVEVTENHHLQSLLDLHYQLSRIVKNYLRVHNRKSLPNELKKELKRFQEAHVDTEAEGCSS